MSDIDRLIEALRTSEHRQSIAGNALLTAAAAAIERLQAENDVLRQSKAPPSES